MIQFVCDSCGAVKDDAEVWVLGLAGDAVGAASARREITILSTWDRPNAVHLLAVHFCSLECKDDYVARLFQPDFANRMHPVVQTVPVEAGIFEVKTPAKRKATQRGAVRRKTRGKKIA
jgi:hypothetical protein